MGSSPLQGRYLESLFHESFFRSPPHNPRSFLEPHSCQCYICLPQFLHYHWLHPNQSIRHTHSHLTNPSGSQASLVRSNNLNLIISVYLMNWHQYQNAPKINSLVTGWSPSRPIHLEQTVSVLPPKEWIAWGHKGGWKVTKLEELCYSNPASD